MLNTSVHPRFVLIVVLSALALPVQGQQVDAERYQRADRIRTAGAHIRGGGVISPTWLMDSVRFYYISNDVGDNGTVYLVDPHQRRKTPLFDKGRMATQLSLTADTTLDPAKLPPFIFLESGGLIEFRLRSRDFQCSLGRYNCNTRDTLDRMVREVRQRGPGWAVRSPDKRWDAFIYEQNLYIRPAELSNGEAEATRDSVRRASAQKGASQQRSHGSIEIGSLATSAGSFPSGSIRLTSDGTRYDSYGSDPSQLGRGVMDTATNRPVRPQALSWSPDSRKLVTFRQDVRHVRWFPLYSVSAPQPRDLSYPYAVPGDSIVPHYDTYIFDVDSRTGVKVQDDPIVDAGHTLFGIRGLRWGSNSAKLFALHTVRGAKRVKLSLVDTRTGEPSLITQDTTETYLEIPAWDVVNDGADIIWYSQRDGWPHYYLYSQDGTLKNQIDSGAYAVQMFALSRVDSAAREVYFTAGGREPGNPYYSHLYRVKFDGTGITHLTPEVATHEITFTPKAHFFIDEYSRTDQAARTVLRSARTGEILLTLAEGDDSSLRAIGWTSGEEFTTMARDGATELWGIMYKPSDFDSTKSYPIITNPRTSGPLIGSVPSWEHVGATFMAWALLEPRALAELGFIVIQLNYLGSAGRSKGFHDFSVGAMGNAGLPDDTAGIRQLAARYSWIDINRVGVYGLSVGGLAAASAILRYPEFYKVAVSTAGNHDQRTYGYNWGERYQGLYEKNPDGSDNYEAAANYTLAANLTGKLLLMHGLLDRNTHPAHTLRLAQALIEANKDFDLIIFPRGGHELPDYGVRKKWDYFVRHLLGAEPPVGYRMLPSW